MNVNSPNITSPAKVYYKTPSPNKQLSTGHLGTHSVQKASGDAANKLLGSSNKASSGIRPDVVKNTVSAILPQLQGANASKMRTNALAPTSALKPPIFDGIRGAEATFESAMKELDRFHQLEKADLEMLESYRDRMTFIQLMRVITKISGSVDAQTQIKWHIACEQRKQDPLGQNKILNPDGLSASLPHQEWIEELLK